MLTIGYYHEHSPFQLVFRVKFHAGFPVLIYSRLDTYNQKIYNHKIYNQKSLALLPTISQI